ncbi:hypothetical protein BpHYR1_012844 [Brachionus plicatilis]|uniref:Uncharacterized protein n=1 Tax=Brachionus plicatilis TaxID=10195 RepID=A0A3M7S571_BRAPC|nr:hypothetical protein BpHYR1_012844 [Brachionus plicatilis]
MITQIRDRRKEIEAKMKEIKKCKVLEAHRLKSDYRVQQPFISVENQYKSINFDTAVMVKFVCQQRYCI